MACLTREECKDRARNAAHPPAEVGPESSKILKLPDFTVTINFDSRAARGASSRRFGTEHFS